jgi:hypothetical protein
VLRDGIVVQKQPNAGANEEQIARQIYL